jgi:aspartyl-tRNA(Asn)/glutamyl-tRNA(Gln) amidotransferase subunit B
VSPPPRYEVVIGLEVHVHLRTQSKLFSPAPVVYGAEPNHAVHEVDLGLPGVLPVLNRRAVELAVRAALAMHCRVQPGSVFARKNYFYPDLPKGYQISQYEAPLATGGWFDLPAQDGAEARRIQLTRIHMEEDAGKSVHDASRVGAGSCVDLNRAGVPLIEIVTEPDLRTPEEAGAFLRGLRELLRWVGVSDADMEKGQLRCDANVSLREPGAPLGVRTECKNLNSFRFVEDALRAEIERQARLLDAGEPVQQATLQYDTGQGRTRVMRLKEDADDYRYFPDPDLIPLRISENEVEHIRAGLPELPEARRARFHALGLSAYEAGVLKGRGLEIEASRLEPDGLVRLMRLVEGSRVTARNARELLPELVERGGDPEVLVRERGLALVQDEAALEAAVAEALAANPEAVEGYRAGDAKVLNFLMGQVMRRTGGKADPGRVRELLVRALGGETCAS